MDTQIGRTWAVEAVLIHRKEHGSLPRFSDVAQLVSELVPCSIKEAGDRVCEALRRDELAALWKDDDFFLDYGPQAVSAAPGWLKRAVEGN